MALKPLNSVAGFSVGQTPANIILANGDITTNNFTTTGVANLNNVGNVLIYGGSSGQVLTTDGNGNLSWSATGSPSSISNGNSNVSIPSVNGNVYINANASTDRQWNFDTTGYLTTAFGGQISNQYDNSNVTGQLMLANAAGGWTGGLAGLNQGGGNNTIYLTAAGIEFYANSLGSEQYWWFDGGGNTSLPAAGTANLGNLAIANYAQITSLANTQIPYANATNVLVGTTNFTYDAPNQVLKVGAGGTELGGDSGYGYIQTTTGNFSGNINSLNANLGNLATANNFATNGTGGDITLTNGNIQGANVVLANSFTSNGGLVDFATNNPNVQLGNVGNVHITGGTDGYVLTTDGTGNLSWSATAAQNQIYNGDSNVSIPTANGNVYINANAAVDQQWNFSTDGTLYFPLVNSQTFIQQQRYGMGNLVGYLDGQWVIGEYNGTSYGTTGIRISPGIEGNVEISLPSDANAATNALQLNNYVGNVSIEAGSYYWNFDSTGNTQFPAIGTANLGNLVTANYANFANDVVVQGNIANANNITTTNNLNVGGNITTGTGSGGNISGVNYLFANVANISNTVLTGKIANGTSNIRLDLNGNITISSNNSSNVFTFSDLGANVLGYIQANGIISAGGFVGSNLVSNVGILSLQAQQTGGDYNINLYAGGAGNVDVNSTYITSVLDPVNPQDAATKHYVDTTAQGLHVHAPANLATVTTLASTLGIASGNVVYDNGTSGVGATLTFTGNSLTSLDGNSVTSGMRLLIKNEANAVWNGVYSIGTNAFFITRSTGEDTDGELNGGDFLFVTSGATFGDTGWVQTTDNVVIGTSNIVFNQFSGVGTYTGANGISVVGTVITANVDHVTTDIIGGNIAVKDGAQLNYPNIGAATGTSLDLTGNVIAGNLNSNATITAVDASFTGNLDVGGNITTTGSTGNISGANVIFANSFVSNGGLVDFNTNSANVQLGSNANVHLYGGSNGQVLQTDGAGNLTWYSISTTSINNGTSNVTIPVTNGNVYINATGSEQWIFDTTGNTTLPATGTVNLGDVAIANTANVNTVNVGPLTQITYGNVTTVGISANQTIASLNATGITGAEFLVKAIDAGGKYSVATVLAVTDGTDVDYTIYGTTQLGGYTGSLAVNVTGGYLRLQVTPASSNSTVWVTQARTI